MVYLTFSVIQTDSLLQTCMEHYSLTVHWVLGHENAKYNEIINKEAKRAAQGHSSPHEALPYELTNWLPISVSRARQEYERHLGERWQHDWLMSPLYERHRHWAPLAASKAHMRLTAAQVPCSSSSAPATLPSARTCTVSAACPTQHAKHAVVHPKRWLNSYTTARGGRQSVDGCVRQWARHGTTAPGYCYAHPIIPYSFPFLFLFSSDT